MSKRDYHGPAWNKRGMIHNPRQLHKPPREEKIDPPFRPIRWPSGCTALSDIRWEN